MVRSRMPAMKVIPISIAVRSNLPLLKYLISVTRLTNSILKFNVDFHQKEITVKLWNSGNLELNVPWQFNLDLKQKFPMPSIVIIKSSLLYLMCLQLFDLRLQLKRCRKILIASICGLSVTVHEHKSINCDF